MGCASSTIIAPSTPSPSVSRVGTHPHQPPQVHQPPTSPVMRLYFATCFVGKVCSATWSTWGASPWEGKSGAEVGIVNTKVARRARAGRAPGARRANIPPLTLNSCTCSLLSTGMLWAALLGGGLALLIGGLAGASRFLETYFPSGMSLVNCNLLCQNRFPRGADEHCIRPRGKHGCAATFYFSESEKRIFFCNRPALSSDKALGFSESEKNVLP